MKLSLRALEVAARTRLEPKIFDFFAGGADDEETLRTNEDAFARIGPVPRVLRGVRPEIALTLLRVPIETPVVIAPMAFHRLAHPDGERATARAAGVRDVLGTLTSELVRALTLCGCRTPAEVTLQGIAC
jgi:4-hydroxymandelate oxidase